MPETVMHDAIDAAIINARLSLAVSRLSPKDDGAVEFETASDVAREVGARRLLAEFGGFDDDVRMYDPTYKDVAARALRDEGFASTDPILMQQRRAMLEYESAVVSLVTVFPEFRDEMLRKTNRSVFELTDRLWRTDTSVRSICDVDGISFQKVNSSADRAPYELDAARRARDSLVEDAARLESAAAMLLARAAKLELEVLTVPLAVASEKDDCHAPRILFHGQALVDYPNTCVPARPGRVLAISAPPGMHIGLSELDPRSDYSAAVRGAHAFRYTRESPRTEHETHLFDVEIPHDATGVLFIVDLNSYKNTLALSGAHVLVIGSSRHAAICNWAERVIAGKKRARTHA